MLNPPVNGKIQGLFKAFESFSSTFQGKFNFQGLFKTVLYIQVLIKPEWTLYLLHLGKLKRDAYFNIHMYSVFKMGLAVRKPVFRVCEQQKCRPANASTQADQHLCHLLPGKYHIKTCSKQNPTMLASLCSWFVWFDSLRPINNLSVIKGQVFLDWTSTKLGIMFLLKDTMQWCRWGLNRGPFSLESSTLPLSHCAPLYVADQTGL